MSAFNPNIKSFLKTRPIPDRPLDYYLDGIIHNPNDYILSEAITLLESRLERHRNIAKKLLIQCFPHAGKSRRISVTGSPGVGKSTFINSIARKWSSKSERSAILTIDPSSQFGKGSILGDKTRMHELTDDPNVFIRPSPASHHLGGVNRHTFEAIVLCEAARKDIIILETVGIGQSETEVYDLTDCSLLLLNPAGGDQLQGIKKGILEIADIAIVHKADGEYLDIANQSRSTYHMAAQTWSHEREGWATPYLTYSSITEQGWEEVIEVIGSFFEWARNTQYLQDKRRHAESEWVLKELTFQLAEKIEKSLQEEGDVKDIQQQVLNGQVSPFEALAKLESTKKINIEKT